MAQLLVRDIIYLGIEYDGFTENSSLEVGST